MKHKIINLLLLITALLVVSACNNTPEEALEATATEAGISQSDQVATQAAATAYRQLELTVTAMPTQTPMPTEEPTATATIEFTPTATVPAELQPPTNTTVPQQPTTVPGGTACYSASLEWESHPDYTELNQSTKFTKIWRIKNIGSCTWNAAFEIMFVDGELMADYYRQSFTEVDVAPGEYAEIAIDMAVPYEAGIYRSDWKLVAADGTVFGIYPGDGTLWVIIESIDL